MTLLQGNAFVTGGGRGIGENIARELASAGMAVAVSGRTAGQVEAVATQIGGRAFIGDVSKREDVAGWFADAGEVDLLVANAGGGNRGESWKLDPDEWWSVFEVNVLGVHLCCNAVIPGMLERGRGRIVIVGSGASYLPGATETGYTSSKAAVCRYGETLANALRDRIPVFVISPGLVRTAMTDGHFSDDAPWTPPECAPQLVRALASGEFDALAGRYLHAEHDPPESLRGRTDEILEHDWNAIRLRRP
ncbi:MAG TPA: SDR family NAD(P)-dependent oxidoreductase [Gaiellaceae bacterium]|nr:SDR family NAD(P)-dependent oxidoreductase [Gaiellaceae bacterium]